MRVRADREICMAAGMCVMTAEVFFDQDADGIVRPASGDVPASYEARVRAAIRLCPSGALQATLE